MPASHRRSVATLTARRGRPRRTGADDTPGRRRRAQKLYGPVIEMKGSVKPSNVTVHVTDISALTVQLGSGVPVTRCAPFGPFASLITLARCGAVRSALGFVVLSEHAATARAIRDNRRIRFM